MGEIVLEIPIVALAIILVMRLNNPSYTSLVFVGLGCLMDILVTTAEIIEMTHKVNEEGYKSMWEEFALKVVTKGYIYTLFLFFQMCAWVGLFVWRREGLVSGLTFSYGLRILVSFYPICCANMKQGRHHFQEHCETKLKVIFWFIVGIDVL